MSGKTLVCELYICSRGEVYEPLAAEGIEYSTERAGAPGRLLFTVVKDAGISFFEGDAVQFRVNEADMFFGYVFKKQRDKRGEITVTCYDQLRYLKNKDTYIYEGKTAAQVVRMIADDFQLKTGTLEDTGYVIEAAVEDNQTLFDIIQNALDQTATARGQLFVLYDDFGKLALRNVLNLQRNIIIDETTAEDYDYTSSIDSGVYNKVKLVYEDAKTGRRQIFISQDTDNTSQWGTLQYFSKLDDTLNAKAQADQLLAFYNIKNRLLVLKGCFGDTGVRAGTSLAIQLAVGDIALNTFMVTEKVVHRFKEGIHTMDLTMRSGDFYG